MGVSLAKGQNVVLNQDGTPLADVTIGLGWDAQPVGGTDFDLDASAIVCGPDMKVISDEHFVFYNNLTSPDGAVRHTGDNLTGDGDGDDEQILIDLDRLDEKTGQVVFAVSIHGAEQRGQNFGQVSDAKGTPASMARCTIWRKCSFLVAKGVSSAMPAARQRSRSSVQEAGR